MNNKAKISAAELTFFSVDLLVLLSDKNHDFHNKWG